MSRKRPQAGQQPLFTADERRRLKLDGGKASIMASPPLPPFNSPPSTFQPFAGITWSPPQKRRQLELRSQRRLNHVGLSILPSKKKIPPSRVALTPGQVGVFCLGLAISQGEAEPVGVAWF